MYDLIYNLIGHSYVQGDSLQQYVMYITGAAILIITAMFFDVVIRLFSNFWKRG